MQPGGKCFGLGESLVDAIPNVVKAAANTCASVTVNKKSSLAFTSTDGSFLIFLRLMRFLQLEQRSVVHS